MSRSKKLSTKKNLVVEFISHPYFANISVKTLPQDTENYRWIVRVSGLEKIILNFMMWLPQVCVVGGEDNSRVK